MTKDLSENLIYIKIKDVANTKNVSNKTIKRACKAHKYEYRLINGNGGQQYEILFSSLEPEIQALLRCDDVSKILPKTDTPIDEGYVNTTKIPPSVIISGAVSTETFSHAPVFLELSDDEIFNNYPKEVKDTLISLGLVNDKNVAKNYAIPENAKKRALYKVDLIMQWRHFRNDSKNKTKVDKEFIKLYNDKLYSLNLYSKLGKVSIQTLYRWNKDYMESGNDYMALIDNYSYGCESHLITNLTTVEKVYLLKYMLHQNRFQLSKAYEYICHDLKMIGIEAHSLPAFRRVWQYIVNNHSDIVAAARGGIKYALDTQLPHITKDLTKLNVGDSIVGDGHTLDFMVKNPETQKPCRATLVAFEDEASRFIIGYDIMITENTQVIASALRHAIINLGKMPKLVHLDNGRAFKGKTFIGNKFDFTSAGIQGIYAKLGIKTTFSKPYNGRAKNIERCFLELTNSLAKLMPSYIGNNIANKPAYTMRNEKFHNKIQDKYVPTIDETREIIGWWLTEIYGKRPALNDSSKTIIEYLNTGRGQGVNLNELDNLMMVSEERQIKKGSIRLFNTRYYSAKLVGLNQKVIAKYDMFDLSYIKIYSKKGEFLCTAERDNAIHPYAEISGTAKDVAEYKAKLKENEKQKKESITLMKSAIKSLYKTSGYSLDRLIKFKKQEVIEAEIIGNDYKINYAENENILAEIENEKIYELDYNKLIENKQKYIL